MPPHRLAYFRSPIQRIGLFVDGSNFFETIKALKLDIDYKALKEYFGAQGRVIKSIYYTAVRTRDGFASIRPTLDWLSTNGWTVVEKEAAQFGAKTKGNMDVEITVDVLQMSRKLDHIFLFTGDGDFCRLVDVIQQSGVKVTIVSSLRTKMTILSTKLRKTADEFVDLEDIRGSIERKDR